jgi:hypothetical protein
VSGVIGGLGKREACIATLRRQLTGSDADGGGT